MDKRSLEILEERLIEVNRVIEKLDPSVRASAFELLKGYVNGASASQSARTGQHESQAPSTDTDLAAMIEKHGHEKPSDNAHLLVADWYRQYGSSPFALVSIKSAAEAAGLTIPERLNMTLRAAQDGGKKLYQPVGRGLYKPTVTGELFLKKTYGVEKGIGTPPVSDES
jgi:hypothetical protein